jgi:hypothetical protein
VPGDGVTEVELVGSEEWIAAGAHLLNDQCGRRGPTASSSGEAAVGGNHRRAGV